MLTSASFILKVFVPVSIAILWIYLAKSNDKVSNPTLLIGILSSREHFDWRNTTRQIWRNYLKQNKQQIKMVFVVGDSCQIPVSSRVDELTCELGIKDLTNLTKTIAMGTELLDQHLDCQNKIPAYPGFTFIPLVNIEVTHLAIHLPTVQSSTILVQSSTIPVQSSTIPVQSSTTSNFHHHKVSLRVIGTENNDNVKVGSVTILNDDYEWKGIRPIRIEAKQEVVLEVQDWKNAWSCPCTHLSSEFLQVIKPLSLIATEGYASQYRNDSCIVPAIKFKIVDLESAVTKLNDYESERLLWTNEQYEIDVKIEFESLQFSDIVKVPVIDVYRNLPTKLLIFFKWVTETHPSTPYILKADDDTFLNIPEILKYVKTTHKQNNNMKWFGSFRYHWGVQRYGKWGEGGDYQSLTYPPFTCGSAYVVSKEISKWLSHNEKWLRRFQGEDVSMGIWLSTLSSVVHINNNRWSCGSSYINNAFTVGQLQTIQDMLQMYERYKECQEAIC